MLLGAVGGIAVAVIAGCVGLNGTEGGRGVLLLTFDDPNYDRWVEAMPLFAKYGAHATFFPCKALDDHALGQLAKLKAAGHTVGVHTEHHRDAPPAFRKIGGDLYVKSEVQPQIDAYAKIGHRPLSMAYPNNARTEETDAAISERAGIRRFRAGHVVKHDPQHIYPKPDLVNTDEVFLPASELPRCRVLKGIGIGESYRTDIDEILACLRRAPARDEALVTYSHDIRPDAKTINMKTEWLERILATAHELGMRIIGFDEIPFAPRTATAAVDWEKTVGPVKPVNGVGQPPMIGAPTSFGMLRYLKDAGIPFARLHDVGGPYGQLRYVDIPNLFRDFDADVDDPKSYTFAYTDALMSALEKNGIEPIFRLGVTIDNPAEHGYPAYFINPPKDYGKWARICEHVIRHYTEGWAGGFKMKVTRWEIWNEPDGEPEVTKNCMWRAPFSEFIRMYGRVAPYLKERFPHLKIGGYGSCGFYAGVGSDHVAAANSSPRMEHFIDCATNFLSAAQANGWPLDFFSFHSYSRPTEALRQVRYADELLTKYGFTRERTERIFDEWLPYVRHENLGTAKQAAGIAAELIALQNGPCDLACIYDARCGVGNYSPLFNPMTYRPHKAYCAFTAFNELRKCGTAVAASVNGFRSLQVAAAKGVEGAAVMIANDTDECAEITYDFGGHAVVSCLLTDESHDASVVNLPAKLQPHAFVIVTLK